MLEHDHAAVTRALEAMDMDAEQHYRDSFNQYAFSVFMNDLHKLQESTGTSCSQTNYAKGHYVTPLTVRQLINLLEEVSDKNKPVFVDGVEVLTAKECSNKVEIKQFSY